eukprot:m.356227 g.356227  ORF g.356227 m.356227 type:complete len:485 (+) comp17474_c0_seq1:44-1498(+)
MMRGVLMGSRVSGAVTRLLRATVPNGTAPTRAIHVARLNAIRATVQPALHTTLANEKVVSFMLADVGEGVAEATIVEWSVAEGDDVTEFDKVCEISYDKGNVDISSRYTGKVVKLYYEEGDLANVGDPLMDIDVDDGMVEEDDDTTNQVSSDQPAASTSSEATQGNTNNTGKALMTPAVRRLTREHNLNIDDIVGSGKNGRILKEDVLDFLEGKTSKKPAAQQQAPAATATTASTTPLPNAPPAPATSLQAEDVTVPVTGIQKAMVKSMTAALQVPHFGYADEIEVDELIKLRTALKPVAQSRDIKLTYMPFILKAASLALKQYPILNSNVNEDCSEVVMKGAHNIGVAMDTPQGLLVPNIKNVESKTVFEIAQELTYLQALGQQNKLKIDQLSGGTFTLSNIGIIGGTYLGPVVVVPEVAIGAIGKFRRVPRFDAKDNVVPVNLMEVSFSADHRVIDGVTIAKFSNAFKQFLENPAAMLSELR